MRGADPLPSSLASFFVMRRRQIMGIHSRSNSVLCAGGGTLAASLAIVSDAGAQATALLG